MKVGNMCTCKVALIYKKYLMATCCSSSIHDLKKNSLNGF